MQNIKYVANPFSAFYVEAHNVNSEVTKFY